MSVKSGRGTESVSAASIFQPSRRDVIALAAAAAVAPKAALAAGAPQGKLTWGIHVTMAPTWFDPAETQGIITPFMVLYALHDAMVKPMPGNGQAPCLAESWSGVGGRHQLRIRAAQGREVPQRRSGHGRGRQVLVRPVSRDLARSDEGAGRGMETPDPQRVIFKLKKPWPDFLTFYPSASGAGWIVPKKYVEKVGDDGFKEAPIGAGPYKFVSFTPGVELVLEAFERLLAQDARRSSAWS